MVKNFLGALAVCASLAMGAEAATITISVSASAVTNPNVVPGGRVEDGGVFAVDSQTASSQSQTASASSGPVSGTATAFADATTGVLRAETQLSGVVGDGRGDGGTVAAARLEETYMVSGTGTITVSMLIDGAWELTQYPPRFPGDNPSNPSFQVGANLGISATTLAQDFMCLGTLCGPSEDQAASGSITDRLLTATASVFAPEDAAPVRITSQLFTQIISDNGFIDFGNTAYLQVEFSSGLTAIAADPNFLSNPAFPTGNGSSGGSPNPAPIPLPAASWLMLAGLAGLGVLRVHRT